MPVSLLWTLLWPSLASIVLGSAAWLTLRRGARPVFVGRLPMAVLALAALITATYPLLGAAPLWVDARSEMWRALSDARYALPLVLALPPLVLLGAVRRRPSTGSGAHLEPRTWRSFLDSRWLVALLAVLVSIVALTLAAGMASQQNDAGEYAEYWVDVGPGAMGTTIYGWHYSLVPSALWVLLCALTWWALSRIARPPLAAAHAADVAGRQLRSANVVRIALGALLLHLEAILRSLASTARLTGHFSAGERSVLFSTGTPFSALAGTLGVLAQVAGVLGLALWVFTVFTAVRVPSAARPAGSAVPS